MRIFLKVLSLSTLFASYPTTLIGCANNTDYRDDRSFLQKEDDKYLSNNQLTLNPKKHVLLFGVDGVPYQNIKEILPTAPEVVFKSNFYIQSYETIKGWKSIFWGNILETGTNVFELIKKNDSTIKTAIALQELGPWYVKHIFNAPLRNNIDTVIDDENFDYTTIDAINYWTEKLLTDINTLTAEGNNFIFAYNGIFDSLKHSNVPDDHPVIKTLLSQYDKIWTNVLKSLPKEDWLIMSTTDHGRNLDGFNHNNNQISSHFAWLLANHDLNTILEHNFSNFYDIRTVILKWLMTN
ncbi:hypothetical protein [Spiroplasma chrysopicola]|uniref:Metalloenzyme domain-containing protein n=1 Tax=Spiroplasma chrysopicola DF-1 TaxID=1276227 RepID=R4UJR1_9MOLU|nr:hypothetical protein [Spiroplasma chrysopicola]AGM25546.1 hypothetical protein SCHRY_v1c09740 [Spiroplasma chrysopicola DF-1]